jgi:hypothetical protein
LAAKAYAKVGIRLTEKSPRRTLPVDIERIIEKDEWGEVSVEYILPIVEPDLTPLIGPYEGSIAGSRALLTNILQRQDRLRKMTIEFEESLNRKIRETSRNNKLNSLKGRFGR